MASSAIGTVAFIGTGLMGAPMVRRRFSWYPSERITSGGSGAGDLPPRRDAGIVATRLSRTIRFISSPELNPVSESVGLRRRISET
jgi:hypothetical protein